MSKALRAGVYILAAYGGCVLIDKKATKWLYSHKDEIVDKISKKIEKLIFGTSKQNEKKPSTHPNPKLRFSGRPQNVSEFFIDLNKLNDVGSEISHLFEAFGEASVADILNIIGQKDKSGYIDTKWGWEDLCELQFAFAEVDGKIMAYIETVGNGPYPLYDC